MIFLRFRPLLDLPVGVAQVRKEPLLSPVWSLSLCRASRCAGVMDFSTLTTDELSSVLQHLSAKQLFAVSNTSHELRTAARQALNAPRFAERKRWAPLGKRLLRVCQHSGRCILTEAPELVAFEEKYWRRTEQPGAGLWVPYDFTERDASPRAEASAASVSAVGRGYLRAVTPSRCVVRMTGPMEDDCQHVVPRCVCPLALPDRKLHMPHAQRTHAHRAHSQRTPGIPLLLQTCDLIAPRWLAHVLPMWPAGAEAELEAGMHAMQDWHPRAFAYVLMRQTVMRYFARYANTDAGRTVSDCAALRGSQCADAMATHGVTDGQVRSAIDALVDEGHLFSTIDDEHFKATFPEDFR